MSQSLHSTFMRNTPNGWNHWHHLRFIKENSEEGDTIVPFSPFPIRYLPSNEAWIQSYAIHCRVPIPWASMSQDPFSTFLQSGGITGTLTGAVGGLSAVAMRMTEPTSVNFAIGSNQRPFSLGYCIGDSYKELLYHRVMLLNQPIFQHSSILDVFQRARLKRFIVHHGFISRYEFIDGKHILTLDIEESVPEGVDISSYFSKIRIKGFKDEGEIELNVQEVLNNFQIVIDSPEEYIIRNGHFYILNTPLLIRDPYQLTGFWNGTESENDQLPSSGFNFPFTNKNQFFYNIEFVGCYVFKEKNNEENDEENNEENEINISINAPGSPMYDLGNSEWVWIKFENKRSVIYGTKGKRHKEKIDLIEYVDESGETDNFEQFSQEERAQGDTSDINAWMEREDISFVRVEIDFGGDSTRNNWHSPILSRGFFKQGDNYFKILGHPEGNIIDISKKDVTDEVTLDLDAEGSIINHYGWFINEHYDNRSGFLGGFSKFDSYDESSNTSKLTIDPFFISHGTRNETPGRRRLEDDNLNTFYNRFAIDSAPSGDSYKAWGKTNGWNICNSRNNYFNIKKINLPVPLTISDGVIESIDVEVYGNAEMMQDHIWINFDRPFERILDIPMIPMTSEQFVEAMDGSLATVCANLGFLNVPIKALINPGTCVGVCEGYMWGDMQNTMGIYSNNYAPLFVTTLTGSSCISSFYHSLFSEKWIFYKDAYTNRLTIRKGSLDLTDMPSKIEISFGIEQANENFDSFPIRLNRDYDRTKMIFMDMPYVERQEEGEYNEDVCLFKIGGGDDYHGFLVNGSGKVLLKPYVMQNVDKSSEDFMFKDFYCSPVMTYKSGKNNMIKRQMLFLGASTREQEIHVDGDSPSNIVVSYVRDEQTLENIGNFDAHLMIDGEIILIYSSMVQPFSIGDNIYNSEDNNSRWSMPKGIFVLGTNNKGFVWNAPLVKDANFEDDLDNQWPLMILSSVEYLSSVYIRNFHSIGILSVHRMAGLNYLGFFKINVNRLGESRYVCEKIDGNGETKFLWRPPYLKDYMDDWQDNRHILMEEKDEDGTDFFVRVMGPAQTESNITSNISNWGNVTIDISTNGIIRSLFDDATGVRMLFSTDGGFKWFLSKIILARNAHSGLFIGNMFFFIDPLGIRFKKLSHWEIMFMYEILEGNSSQLIEEFQEEIDQRESALIGSGRINPQRLDGSLDNKGIYNIYYYDLQGQLCSLRSSDSYYWKMSHNF